MKFNVLDIDRLRSDLCDQFSIEMIEHEIVLSTGVLFVSGDSVQVLISPGTNDYIVSDQSSAAMYLESHGVTIGSKLQHNFENLTQRFGCSFMSNRVQRRCYIDQLPVAILMVANASRLVGDYVLDIRREPDKDFKRAVSDNLYEVVGERMKRRESVKGSSGRTWHVDNVVFDKQLESPVAFIETIANRNVVPWRVATFLDLRKNHENTVNLAIVKEESDLKHEDCKLLNEVGGVVVPLRKIKQKFEQHADVA